MQFFNIMLILKFFTIKLLLNNNHQNIKTGWENKHSYTANPLCKAGSYSTQLYTTDLQCISVQDVLNIKHQFELLNINLNFSIQHVVFTSYKIYWKRVGPNISDFPIAKVIYTPMRFIFIQWTVDNK